MKLGRLNHVGVATPSIERSLTTYRELFGTEPHGPAFELPAQGVRVCFVDAPNAQIELIEPLGDNSPVAKFLEKNPLGGQHHVCFEVPDITPRGRSLRPRARASLARPASARTARRSFSSTRRTWAACSRKLWKLPVESLPLMGSGRGGVLSDAELDVRYHPHPTSPIKREELV